MSLNSQLLADSSRSFRGSASLDSYDLNKIRDAAQIFGFVLFTGQSIDLNCDGSIGFALDGVSI